MLISEKNKKSKSKLATVLLILIMSVLFLACSMNNQAESRTNGEKEALYQFAKDILNEDRTMDKINGNLIPQRKIELLNSNSEVIAEYIEFQSESEEYIGYIIRDIHNGHIYDYSAEGNLFEGLLTKSGLTYDDAFTSKVYFVNPFEIYIELVGGKIIDLMPASGTYPVEITKNQLEDAFSLRSVEYRNSSNEK
ncbi:MAG: hypothetical protein GX347_07925 [Epulopiscium sp.]|nr:hypothetical protein [Candidatus Epulonipiscium sp.]